MRLFALCFAMGIALGGCAKDGAEEDSDEVTTTEEDEPSETKTDEPQEGEVKTTKTSAPFNEEDEPEETTSADPKTDPNDPVGPLETSTPKEDPTATPPTETPTEPGNGVVGQTPGKSWEPNNSGNPPAPIAQSELRLDCQQKGPGLTSGYVRYGCQAMRRDGQRYGIVLGWWRILRRDGVRAHCKDLNFRETGYDMAFDVLAEDAQGGIVMQPATGEAPPRT